MTVVIPPHTYKASKVWYSRKFNRSLPTIGKWMNQDAPLDDDDKMAEWIESRNAHIVGNTGVSPVPGIPEVHPSATDIPQRHEERPPLGVPAPVVRKTGSSEVALKAAKAEVDLDIARHKLQVLRNEVISREQVKQAGIAIGSILDAELSAIEQEIPGVCAGLSEKELKTKLPSFFIRIRKNVKDQLTKHIDTPQSVD